ncbi:hypothetical protein FKP32DRAFT_1644946 [Trametes sanguinea]|nr:hypothetical protein FKP32DRAFT_1644946 [Trametes sanguinea]
MVLFDGQAWFSPRVPAKIKQMWSLNGGSCAGPQSRATRATYVFCDGTDDPWFHKLVNRSFAVFHWVWISAVVDAHFRVPISKYAIDGSEKPCPPAYTQLPPSTANLQGPDISQKMPQEWTCESEVSTSRLSGKSSPLTRPLPEEDSKDVPLPNPAARRKRRVRSTPYVDLRRRSSKSTRSEVIRIEPLDKAVMSKTSRSRCISVGPLGASGARSSNIRQVIPVSVALESLGSISVDNIKQFVPGSVHLGKEFRCFYAT